MCQIAEQIGKLRETAQATRVADAFDARAHALAHAEKFDAVTRALQQRQQFVELGQQRCRVAQRLVGELDDHVALGHTAFGHVGGNPVVRQPRAGEH